MDLRKLKTLIDLVAESDIAELEVTEGEGKVRIVKSSAMPQNQVVMMQPQAQQAAPLAAAPIASAAPVAAAITAKRAIFCWKFIVANFLLRVEEKLERFQRQARRLDASDSKRLD